jgi:uncharacterized protein
MDEPGPWSTQGSSVRLKLRRQPRWKLALSWCVEVGCSLLGGRRFYRSRNLLPGRFLIRHECIEVDDLPKGLEGFRIAHLSDLHAGRFIREGDLSAVVEAINQEGVDLHVLTGDYITHDVADAFQLTEDLGRLRSRHGGYAVLGNHDYRGRQEGRIVERFGEVGVHFLRNGAVRIERGDGTLALTGVEDLEEGKVIDVDGARAQLEEGDVEVLLCHNPRGGKLLARRGCAAVLSGHTHGGQIVLPGLRRLVGSSAPRHPGERVQCGPTTLIVNRGLGVVAVPFRYKAPAEVVIVTLSRGGA